MVRIGILGAGNIAHRFAASLAHEEGAELVAASRRTAEGAQAFLDEVPHAAGARAYGSHDELLADPEVDAIYLSLPHAFHREWAVAALRAGKHVLCEKPAALTAEEMGEIADVARETGRLFVEAMKPRFQPIYPQIVAAVDEIGTVTSVEASLCNDMMAYVEGKPSYHLTPGPGAGVLLDCGTYAASWLADLCPGEPEVTSIAGAEKDGIDIYALARMSYGGVNAVLECAFDRAKPRTCTITGTKGTIVVDELHRPTHATVTLAAGTTREIDVPYVVDDFYGEISHFVGLVENGTAESPLMPLADSVHTALVLDKIRERFAVTPEAMDVLAEQERVLRYPAGASFGAKEALELGSAIAGIADDYDLGYVIRITREADGYELFGWGADGKKPANYDYADGKRQASLRLGHCSLWGWTEAQLAGTGDALFDQGDMPVAGAFPVLVGDERVATVAVSGLHEGLDHELLVRGLSQVLGVSVPAYPCVTV